MNDGTMKGMMKQISIALTVILATSLHAQTDDMPSFPGPRDNAHQTGTLSQPTRTNVTQPKETSEKRETRNTTASRDIEPRIEFDSPHLPSPQKSDLGVTETGTPFPAARLDQWWRAYSWNRSAAVDPGEVKVTDKQLREELRAILPKGLYVFGPDCALVKFGKADVIQLRMSCMTADSLEMMNFARGRGDRLRTQLQLMSDGQKITGEFYLMELFDRDGKPGLIFREKSFEFVNPYLRLLHQRNPLLTEADLLRPEIISVSLPALLSYAGGSLTDLLALVPAGSWIPFHTACPLVMDRLQKLEGESAYRLEVQLSCSTKSMIASIKIPAAELENESAFLSEPGTKLYGELKAGSLYMVDGRPYIDWDGARNFRRAEKK